MKKLKLRKKKEQRCSKCYCAEGSVVEQDDMSDEEYEKRVDQIFELFGTHESN